MTSLEQRTQIKRLTAEQQTAPQIAQQLGISVHTVRKWQQIIKKGAYYIHQWVAPRVVV